MISIRKVLAEIDITYEGDAPKSFSIEYIKDNGEWGKIARATKNEKRSGSTKAAKSNFKYSVKEKGVVLLFNLDTEEFRSIKIDRIQFYNGMEVFH